MKYSEYRKNTIYIEFPLREKIKEAWSRLPAKGRIDFFCNLEEVPRVLRDMEKAGFFGMKIYMTDPGRPVCRIIAFKGKEGPCYETGRSAFLRADFPAALDDDLHLVFDDIRICEKTAGIYSLPVYSKYLEITDAESGGGGHPSVLRKSGR